MNNKNQLGFTLVEILLYLSISTILLAVSASSLKNILDYQQVIIEKGNLYENSARFFSNFSLDARNSSGFEIQDGGNKVRIIGDTDIYYFRDGDRIKKQVGTQDSYFITDSESVITSLNFSVAAGVVRVDVDFNNGEYTPTGHYWSRNYEQ